MPANDGSMTEPDVPNLEQLKKGAQPGIVRELWSFFRHRRKWWLVPVVVLLLLVGLFVVLSGTAAAPLIYTLF